MRERTYQLTYLHHAYTIICLEFKKETNTILIIPEFLLPGRPYPIYVYLYAINLYSANPDKSQRESADATRKRFGLTTFSHTTLGRALKQFIKKLPSEAKAEPSLTATESEKTPPHPFPSRQTTRQAREQASQFFQRYSFPQAEASESCFLDACHTLVNKYFKTNQQLLL
jgi:hypothetical protein